MSAEGYSIKILGYVDDDLVQDIAEKRIRYSSRAVYWQVYTMARVRERKWREQPYIEPDSWSEDRTVELLDASKQLHKIKEELSSKQWGFLLAYAEGASFKELADMMGWEHTGSVSTYLSRIRRKIIVIHNK